jgi:hypothetical protein
LPYNQPMRIPLAAGIALVLISSGCGSIKESFQTSFDKSFKESCRSESVKRGATQKVAEKYCDCALVKFKETKSMEQATKACNTQVKSELNR